MRDIATELELEARITKAMITAKLLGYSINYAKAKIVATRCMHYVRVRQGSYGG